MFKVTVEDRGPNASKKGVTIDLGYAIIYITERSNDCLISAIIKDGGTLFIEKDELEQGGIHIHLNKIKNDPSNS